MIKVKEQAPFENPITIYYEDTDISGVVYYVNYLKFFERARTELLCANGVDLLIGLQEGKGFVVKTANINYIKGATLGEKLIVQTSILEIRKASLLLLQRLVDSNNEIYCSAEIRIAYVDHNKRKPITIPFDIRTEKLSEC